MNVNDLPIIMNRLKGVFQRREFQEIKDLPVDALMRRSSLRTLHQVVAFKCFEEMEAVLKRPLSNLEKTFMGEQITYYLESCRPWFYKIQAQFNNQFRQIGVGDWIISKHLGFVGRVRKVIAVKPPTWKEKLYVVKLTDRMPPIVLPASQMQLFVKRKKTIFN